MLEKTRIKRNRIITAIVFISLCCYIVLTMNYGVLAVDSSNGTIKSFGDINPTDPETPYVNYLVSKGIVNGYPDGNFYPNQGLTRAQAAAAIAKAAGLTIDPNLRSSFGDVKEDHWARASIAAAAQAGYLKGYPDGNFYPDEKINRAQAITLLLRLSKEPLPDETLPSLTDINDTHWAAKSIAVGIASGMMGLSTDNQQFMPNVSFSRINLVHALGIILTGDPTLSQSSLEGSIKSTEGTVSIIKSGSQSEKTLTTGSLVNAGDTIKTGTDGETEIDFPDGSSLLLKPDTVIVIKETRGKKYIKTDGQEGIAVDWLNVEIKQGNMFGALAAKHDNEEIEKALNQSSKLQSSRLLASLHDWSYLAAANGNAQAWYQAGKTKKVKVKVDMPWGVAAIKGTFWNSMVNSNGSGSTSVLTGSGEVIAGGQTVSLASGQATQGTGSGAPPSAPTAMTATQMSAWNQAQSWVTATLETIQSQSSSQPPPPVATEPIDSIVNSLTPVQNQSGGTLPGVNPNSQPPANGATPNSGGTPAGGGGTGGGSGGGGSGGGGGSHHEDVPNIQSISDLNISIARGESYQLPETIPAVLTSGITSNVNVSWNPATINTDQPGTYTFTGTVSNYIGSVTLNVTVKGIKNIENLNQNISLGEDYKLPTTVIAILSDNSSRAVPVTWSVSTVDTSIAGTLTLSGTIKDYSGTITLTLNIQGIKTINSIEKKIVQGEDYQLPATVTATLNDNSSKEVEVTWSETVDTTPGVHTYTGSVENYNQDVTLTLTVIGIKSIADIKVKIKEKDTYEMPTTVKAVLTDNSEKDLSVTWDNNSPDTNQPKEITINGTVKGYSGTVKLIITVEKKPTTEITGFTLAEQISEAIIDKENHSVQIKVKSGTDITRLAPTMTISEGATINPTSQSVQNFSSPITYTVTGKDNTTQAWTVTVTMDKSNNAELSSLGLSAGSLVFNKEQSSYSVSVENAVSSITVNAAAADSKAKVSINGAGTSASVSTSMILYEGINSISITVTAEDGTTTRSYSISIERAQSPPPPLDLSGATVTADTMILVGSSFNLSITDAKNTTGSYLTGWIHVQVKKNSDSQPLYESTVEFTTGQASIYISSQFYSPESFQIYVFIDGVTSSNINSLHLNICAPPSSDATVKTAGSAEAGYVINNTNGTITGVPAGTVADLKADILVNESNASLKVLAAETQIANITDFNAATALTGETVLADNQLIAVKAQNGTIKVYTITLAIISHDATITAGTLATVALAGTFTGGTDIAGSSALTVTIPDASKTNAVLVLTKNNANSVIKYIKGTQPNVSEAYTNTYATESTQITVENNDVIWLLVRAQDGTTKKYYKITVTTLSSDATISAGTLATVGIAGTFAGGADIAGSSALTVAIPDASKTNAAITLTKGNADSTIKYVIGSEPANNSAYANTYTAGSTTITVANNDVIWLLVTAQDGTTKKYYKITVTTLSSDATISAGTLAGVSLMPDNGTSWNGAGMIGMSSGLNVTVPAGSAALELTKNNANSVIKYVLGLENPQPANDAAYTSTYVSGSTNIDITSSDDRIWLLVTAEDGTKRYYWIKVTVTT